MDSVSPMFIHMFDTLKLFSLVFSAVKLRPKEGETYFDVVAIVDPVTRDAQRLAPLLLVRIQCCNAFYGNFKQLPQFCNFGMFVFSFDWMVTSDLLRMHPLHNTFISGKTNYAILHTNKISLRYCLHSF